MCLIRGFNLFFEGLGLWFIGVWWWFKYIGFVVCLCSCFGYVSWFWLMIYYDLGGWWFFWVVVIKIVGGVSLFYKDSCSGG